MRKSFFIGVLKWLLFILEVFVLLLIGFALSYVLGVSFLTGLHIVIVAMLVDIMTEVDGLRRVKDNFERWMVSKEVEVHVKTREKIIDKRVEQMKKKG